MASFMCSIECPNCGRSAIEDDYYKSDERYVFIAIDVVIFIRKPQ
ncbi:hypothetical protein [Bacillus sp. FSL K6-3431]